MKKTVLLIAGLLVFAVGCSKDKKGGGGNTDPNYNYYNNPYGQPYGPNGQFNGHCPGFDIGNNATNPYQVRNGYCTDLRNNQRAPEQYCQHNTLNNGWGGGGPGLNNPACYAYQGQYHLNYFYQGACSHLNKPQLGLYYREYVLPNTRLTRCIEYQAISTYQQQYYSGYHLYSMPQYPGAVIGCIPGQYVPAGCNCVGVNAGAGAGFGFYAGIWPFFGVQVGAQAHAGAGWQAGGYCVMY